MKKSCMFDHTKETFDVYLPMYKTGMHVHFRYSDRFELLRVVVVKLLTLFSTDYTLRRYIFFSIFCSIS